MAKKRRTRWYTVATKTGYTVTRTPSVRGGRFAFGPYHSKRKACEVGQYQGYGRLPRGC